jgi:hypothetical protein
LEGDSVSEHREKAVEAAAKARHGRALHEHWADVGGERRERLLEEARLDLQAAEPHLQRMYLERFRELLLGDGAVAMAKLRHSLLANYNAPARAAALEDARAGLEAALDKAQDLMEGESGGK